MKFLSATQNKTRWDGSINYEIIGGLAKDNLRRGVEKARLKIFCSHKKSAKGKNLMVNGGVRKNTHRKA